jgi:uncharacterized protein YutE (UPF0331/DUF86 family)
MVIDYKHRLIKRVDYIKSSVIPFFNTYDSVTREKYNSDIRLRREVEKWVEDTINCVIDISKILYSEKKMVIPETSRGILENIDLLGLSEVKLGSRISQWAILRNRLAHDYLDLKWEGISKFIKEGEVILNLLTSRVEDYIKMD